MRTRLNAGSSERRREVTRRDSVWTGLWDVSYTSFVIYVKFEGSKFKITREHVFSRCGYSWLIEKRNYWLSILVSFCFLLFTFVFFRAVDCTGCSSALDSKTLFLHRVTVCPISEARSHSPIRCRVTCRPPISDSVLCSTTSYEARTSVAAYSDNVVRHFDNRFNVWWQFVINFAQHRGSVATFHTVRRTHAANSLDIIWRNRGIHCTLCRAEWIFKKIIASKEMWTVLILAPENTGATSLLAGVRQSLEHLSMKSGHWWMSARWRVGALTLLLGWQERHVAFKKSSPNREQETEWRTV